MAIKFKNTEEIRAKLIKALVLENKKTQRADNSPAINTRSSNQIIDDHIAKLK